MTAKEIGALSNALARSRRYLEFGIGNSTRLACLNESIHRIDVVESSNDPNHVQRNPTGQGAWKVAFALG